jgi:hypothetical protein
MQKVRSDYSVMWTVLVAILSAILITGTALAQQDSKKKTGSDGQTSTEKQDQTVTIKGKVTTVTDSTLTVVDASKKPQTITLDATTKVTKGGKDATVADLKTDDSVVVLAKKGEGDVLMAISITVA